MAYCNRCGTWAELDPAAMCGPCRRDWQPAAPAPADLGYRTQPQSSSGLPGQAADLQLRESRITFPQVGASSKLGPGPSMSFTFGPAWARSTGCCGKPAGCTNTGLACLMRGHPWKRRHAVTTPQPVSFRAGRAEQATAAAVVATPSVITGGVTLLADVSEFQPDVTDQLYLAWSKAIVIRAMYGSQHDDRAWYGGQRRDLLHAGGVRFLGIYQYVVAGQDAVAQARALAALLGQLRPGEKVIGDFEEGTGNQAHRRDLWAATIRARLGDPPWIYSGLNYARDHGLAPVDWVAAYGQADPPVPYKLWQFTDAFSVPGVGTCDCSIFHGTVDELAALAYGGQQQPNWTEALLNTLPVLTAGNRDHPGTVQFVRRLQALVKVIGDVNGLAAASAVVADGNFGAATRAGVLQVQQFFGITADGTAGPATWAALVAGQRP